MRIIGIEWLGLRTQRYMEQLAFYRDVLNLEVAESPSEEFVLLTTENGDRVELFGPASEYNRHFPETPVAGFHVADLDEAVAELRAAGVEIVHEGAAADGATRWAHFRAPDGNLYDISWHAAEGSVE